MNPNPMVDEVNKIVYNLLVAEHALSIPSVGSLRVERQPAKRISKSRIVPPYYTVVYTSQTVGILLPDAIAAAAGCDAAAAQDACYRWLSHVRQGEVLVIDRVGVLRQKSFAVEASFDKILNPQGHKPMTIRTTENHWVLWILSVTAIVCGVSVCGWIGYDHLSNSGFFEEGEPEIEVVQRVEPRVVETVDSLAVVAQDTLTPAAPVVAPAPVVSVATLDAQPLIKGHSYAVLGVYSTEKNAQYAAREALKTDASLSCGVYTFGAKYLVSIYASDDAAACEAFAQRQCDNFPDVWCHKSR
ncbi:MAG: hypothetical protein RSB29_01305 [Alistipes sp.]